MTKKFLEAGKIVNTHGVRGEVRITPWADSATGFSGGRNTSGKNSDACRRR